MSDILNNEIDIQIEFDTMVEYQIKDYIFLQYSKNSDVYYIKYLTQDLDEEIFIVNENDFPIVINSTTISLEDFLYFKTLTI